VRSARLGSHQNPGRAPWAIAGTTILSLFLLAAARGPRRQQAAVAGPSSGSGLETILARSAEYCDRLDRAVLDFVCRERIEQWLRPSAQPAVRHGVKMQAIFLGPRVDHSYIYDYQLIRDREGSFKESRTLLKEDGKDVRVPDAPLKTRRFAYAKIVMGPLGLLSRENQTGHDYRVVREEKVRGEETLVIEAIPKPGAQFQHLFGTLWLRKKDAGVVKIEWNPASIDDYQWVERTAEFLGLTPWLRITSEFAFEKNGIRFPSRCILKETYRRGTGGALYPISEIEAVYDRYKFFTVETAVKY